MSETNEPEDPPAASDAPAVPDTPVVTPADAPAETPAVVQLSPAECAARLADLFPALFTPGQPKPVKLRIQVDIQARAPGVFTKKALSAFLHRHTTANGYLKALAAAAQRIDLDGMEAGEISEEHRQAAVAELARRRELVQARRAAERATQRDLQREAQRANPRDTQRDTTQREAPRQSRRAPKPGPRSGARAAPQGAPGSADQRAAAPARPAVPPPVLDEAAQRRQALLRAWETTTLTPANFLALKGLTQADLDADLALARADRERRGPGPAPAPDRRPSGPGGPGEPRRPRRGRASG